MRIQTVVQHAGPPRSHLLPALLASLPEGATVVTDPEPDSPRRSPWRTYVRCLQSLEPDASHLVIVQDDALICRDFGKAVDLIGQKHPGALVALFTPGLGLHARRVRAACEADERYAVLDGLSFVPAVCLLWPRELVAGLLAYVTARPFPVVKTADDGNLGEWARAAKVSVVACVPSLVEHPDVERSLIGRHALAGRNPARVASCWVGLEMSPLGIDWS